jgi:hypothetical protein
VQAGALVNGTALIWETRLPESFTHDRIEWADIPRTLTRKLTDPPVRCDSCAIVPVGEV